MLDKNLIKEQLEILDKLEAAFKSSISRVENIDYLSLQTFEDWEPIDAFFDRYERLIDYLFQRVFRTVYKIKNLSDPNSLIDLIHFLVINNFAEDEKFLIGLKELRNKIAHEYLGIGIYSTFDLIDDIIFNFTNLELIINNVRTYLRNYLKN